MPFRPRLAPGVAGTLAAVLASLASLAASPEAPAARYATVDDRRVFVLDRSAAPPLLQFEGSPEVLALSARPAARGDLVFQLDTGRDLLRLTDIGGATLYPPERDLGVPAERTGPAAPIAPPAGGSSALIAARETLLGRWQEAAGMRPTLEDAAAAAADPSLTADAIRVLARAVAGLRRGGGANLAAIGDVRVVLGSGADVQVEPGALIVQIAPEHGYAGRPSSHRIQAAITNADLAAGSGLALTASVASPAARVQTPQN